MSDTPAIQARGLHKRYEGGRIAALRGLDLEVGAGEFVAICGPSGCGKSTLLNMIAAIDRPDEGTLTVFGQHPELLDGPGLDAYRRRTVGLVFQLHNLLPYLTAAENVQVPLMAAEVEPGTRPERALSLLDSVGLADRAGARPTTLSGGERQRVAIARALANEPRLLLADEPTGALDSRNGAAVLDLLADLRASRGMTVIVVTHENAVAERAERVIHMLDGSIQSDG